MNIGIASFFANLVSLSLGCIAGYMAIHGISGWGWFLFAALLCVGSVSINKDKSKTE